MMAKKVVKSDRLYDGRRFYDGRRLYDGRHVYDVQYDKESEACMYLWPIDPKIRSELL